jgi:hypothetical protein
MGGLELPPGDSSPALVIMDKSPGQIAQTVI